MDKVGSDQAAKVLKKGKKKQAKDELDRQKQAEKKRRRLEKALANSAAIISELEKKKQKKKEEQQRLDEEGAAIAEAVALHVLIGEDSVEPCHLMPNKHRRCDHWDYSAGFGVTPDLQGIDSYSPGLLTHIGHAHGSKGRWTNWGIGQPFPHWGQVRDLQAPFCQGTFEQSKTCLGGDCQAPYFQETFQQSNTCPGFLAAQAVSSLQIRENSSDDIFPSQGPAAAVINRMLGNRLNLYREL